MAVPVAMAIVVGGVCSSPFPGRATKNERKFVIANSGSKPRKTSNPGRALKLGRLLHENALSIIDQTKDLPFAVELRTSLQLQDKLQEGLHNESSLIVMPVEFEVVNPNEAETHKIHFANGDDVVGAVRVVGQDATGEGRREVLAKNAHFTTRFFAGAAGVGLFHKFRSITPKFLDDQDSYPVELSNDQKRSFFENEYLIDGDRRSMIRTRLLPAADSKLKRVPTTSSSKRTIARLKKFLQGINDENYPELSELMDTILTSLRTNEKTTTFPAGMSRFGISLSAAFAENDQRRGQWFKLELLSDGALFVDIFDQQDRNIEELFIMPPEAGFARLSHRVGDEPHAKPSVQ